MASHISNNYFSIFLDSPTTICDFGGKSPKKLKYSLENSLNHKKKKILSGVYPIILNEAVFKVLHDVNNIKSYLFKTMIISSKDYKIIPDTVKRPLSSITSPPSFPVAITSHTSVLTKNTQRKKQDLKIQGSILRSSVMNNLLNNNENLVFIFFTIHRSFYQPEVLAIHCRI